MVEPSVPAHSHITYFVNQLSDLAVFHEGAHAEGSLLYPAQIAWIPGPSMAIMAL